MGTLISATISCNISWFFILLIIVLFIVLAMKSNYLRDSIDNRDAFMEAASKIKKFAGKEFEDIPKPYSLARTQLAVWTVVISCSYIFLAFCGPAVINLGTSPTAIALLGISAGTTGVANVIDNSQGTNAEPNGKRHQDEPSKGFLIDILSDNNGVSIHRFQNAIWTIVAIAVYVWQICPGQTKLPELDNTLLSLTGISSAAYLGLKMNENK